MNFSEYGLFLQTRDLLKVKTPVRVSLPIKPNQEVAINGVVATSRNDQPFGTGLSKGGLGIEFSAVPQEYLDFIAQTRN